MNDLIHNLYVEKGAVYNHDGASLGVNISDRIARANGFVYAEEFVKFYDGKRLKINGDTLKVVKAVANA